MALKKLRKKDEAERILDNLLQTGEEMSTGEMDVDFFSKFGEGQSVKFVRADGNYLIGLACLGKGKKSDAKKLISI